ncbi:DMT family transporter [Devosia submarina]|uniref:DMT family transporter n=1 Tax=Devosia submarina TaxID=1173082 RepID=UPI000D3A8B58|nr:DMT family transporter [Devosia submarina]
MSRGVFLAILAYGLFSCADALIKSTGGALSVFEVGFFTSLFAILPAVLTKQKSEPWREALRFHNPLLLNLRGISGVVGSACVIYAFTHIPLADVYSLAFLAPLFVVVLSAILLKEVIPRRRWPLMLLSFIGVLIVVRPGFRDLQLGHLAALACAFFTASNTILLRSLAPTEHRLGIFAVVTTYALTVNSIGMLVWGFEMPSLQQLGTLLAIGILGGIGHLTFINATSFVPANQVAPTQYTQMIWAIALGAAFYGEYVDLPAVFGIALLAAAGLLNVLSDERIDMIMRGKSIAGTKVFRTGQSEAEKRATT